VKGIYRQESISKRYGVGRIYFASDILTENATNIARPAAHNCVCLIGCQRNCDFFHVNV
jgi:hypothetical protein